MYLLGLQTCDRTVACHPFLCTSPSDPEGKWFESPRHTVRCIEDVGNRKERTLSLILRPSLLINRDVMGTRLTLLVW